MLLVFLDESEVAALLDINGLAVVIPHLGEDVFADQRRCWRGYDHTRGPAAINLQRPQCPFLESSSTSVLVTGAC